MLAALLDLLNAESRESVEISIDPVKVGVEVPVDVAGQLRRLRSRLARLSTEPEEAARVDELAATLDEDLVAYRKAEAAESDGELVQAEYWYGLAADADYHDAHFRLARILSRRNVLAYGEAEAAGIPLTSPAASGALIDESDLVIRRGSIRDLLEALGVRTSDEGGASKSEDDTEQIPCRVHDAELWFAELPADVERAKALCGTCPVLSACLAGALERREPWGVWGGQLFIAGVVVPAKRPRARSRVRAEEGVA